jgi:hypothetical protein
MFCCSLSFIIIPAGPLPPTAVVKFLNAQKKESKPRTTCAVAKGKVYVWVWFQQ